MTGDTPDGDPLPHQHTCHRRKLGGGTPDPLGRPCREPPTPQCKGPAVSGTPYLSGGGYPREGPGGGGGVPPPHFSGRGGKGGSPIAVSPVIYFCTAQILKFQQNTHNNFGSKRTFSFANSQFLDQICYISATYK